MTSPFEIVKDLEDAICEFTDAPYCVVVNSCTNALAICLEWHRRDNVHGNVDFIEIPKHTYISVPVQIKRAGFNVQFADRAWLGAYMLEPFNIWDSARRFERGLFSNLNQPNYRNYRHKYICLSFHSSKILGYEQGGAILHNNDEFDSYARKMRFDGRSESVAPKYDNIDVLGMHCYMSPTTAAGLLWKLSYLENSKSAPTILPNDDYPDLSQMGIFK